MRPGWASGGGKTAPEGVSPAALFPSLWGYAPKASWGVFRSQMGLLGTLGGLPGGSKGRIPRGPFSKPLGIRPPPLLLSSFWEPSRASWEAFRPVSVSVPVPVPIPVAVSVSVSVSAPVPVPVPVPAYTRTICLQEDISAYRRPYLLTRDHICLNESTSAYRRAYLVSASVSVCVPESGSVCIPVF